ncbi:MAG: aldehyde dehydrogenase family protein [Planctomycetes bacterium]|nr:aldehyde dehydrogenase family protein [Planctomycetota bacterium]
MLSVVNPASGSVVAELVEDTPENVASAYARAHAAQKAWARIALAERMARIVRFRALVAAAKDDLARTLTSETGKPIAQARNELGGFDARIEFFLENVETAIADQVVHSEKSGKVEERIAHSPLGVIANISAWNYPWFVGGNVFIPALLTGNSVLYKPSEFSPMTGLAIARLLREARVPDDVFIPLIGGAVVGAALLAQPIDGVFFTGSYATGKRVAETVAPRMIKYQLELGGKDPVYVCEDVDIAATAAATADGAFYNAGQSCCAIERLYVQRDIIPRFIEEFAQVVAAFRIGDPLDESTYIGPITRPAQIAVFERQIADAVAKGAKVLCGGKRLARSGSYFAPTVLVDVDHTMEVMRDETFGPVIGIMAVADDAEAVRLMNDTEYGLTAGVYTRDRARAEAILADVDSGTAYWNCCDRVSPRLPWTGRGWSGIGSTLSVAGITAFTQPKAWHLVRG